LRAAQVERPFGHITVLGLSASAPVKVSDDG